MKPEWKSFLINKGAETDDASVTSFGNPVREVKIANTGDILADLSHIGLISAYGEDTMTFLQGQFTNDTRLVSNEKAQLSAYCNPKGRILANFLIFMRGDTWYLAMPREMIESTLKRLRMFLLNAKVTLEDASDSLVHFGYSGPNAESELADLVKTVPAKNYDASYENGLNVIRIPGTHPRFEIYGELEAMEKAWSMLDVRGAPVGKSPWSLLDILAAVPVIQPETTEAFVPQMVNMHLPDIDGVSFKKGCYTGQEIVARMQYLGKLKRRMYLAHVETESVPKPGDNLFSSSSSSGQGAGKVVSAEPGPDGGYEMLIVLEISSFEAGKVHLQDITGPEIVFKNMPYPFE
jgi:folate-binding protein YgfZ